MLKVFFGGDFGEDIINRGKIYVLEVFICGIFFLNSKMLKNGYDEGEKGMVVVILKMFVDVKFLNFYLLDLNVFVGRESFFEGENGCRVLKKECCLGLLYDNELYIFLCIY